MAEAFAIYGWRDEHGAVTVVATDQLMSHSQYEYDAWVAGGREGRVRFGLYDRTLHFAVDGNAQVAERDHGGSFVEALLRLLERWLPEDDAVIEVLNKVVGTIGPAPELDEEEQWALNASDEELEEMARKAIPPGP